MKNKILIGSIIAVALLTLVSFSSVVGKISTDGELVEFDVEFSGLGKKQTIQLTQQEADEVELLFDDIEQRLSEVKTREEAEVIFKDTVVKLDKYGLLGGLSVRQVQKLVTSNMQQSTLFNQEEYININNEKDTNNSNLMCLIAGKTSETFITGILGRIALNLAIPLHFISEIIESLPDSILRTVLEGMFSRCYDFVLIYLVFVSLIDTFIPVSIGDVIIYDDSQGWVLTFGLYGFKNWNGTINGNIESLILSLILESIGVFGFRGIKVYIRPSEMTALSLGMTTLYLGQANYVNIETE